jgi:hypothetical protein
VRFAREWKVPPQELSFYVDQLMANPVAREEAWTWIQTEWDEIQKRAAGPAILRGVVKSFSSLQEPRQLKEAAQLLAKRPPKDAAQVVEQTLERMRQLSKLRPAVAKSVERWTRAE